MSLKGAVALVTGGTRGLGRAVVEKFVDIGMKGVVSFDLATPGKHEDKILACVGDVTSEVDVQKALAQAKEKFGEYPRVVVNCAGIAPSIRVVTSKPPHAPHSLEVFEKVLKVNVLGSFNVLRLSAEKMIQQNIRDGDKQSGLIVNTASIAAFDGQIGQIAYSASKGAIASMTLPAARDLATYGIRVVCVAPGVFNTPMVAALPEPAKVSLAQQIPFPPRLGDPKEFAEFVATAFLGNVMLNGEIIRLDGALRMGPR
jgi:NAD(P)-dependent dehydrogenase (short-subunit alcohol dehydrogenase family)